MAGADVALLPPAGARRTLGLALGYLAGFLLLDWVSYIRPFQGLNITPWNPQPALAVALLLRRPRWLWLVWLGLVLTELVVRGLPARLGAMLMATAALALCYAAIAAAARRWLDRQPALTTRRQLARLTMLAIAGALLSAAVYVSVLALAGVGPGADLPQAIVHYWIGDAVGLLVTLPLLLMLMDPERRAPLAAVARRREVWLLAALAGLLLLAVFGRSDSDHFKSSYLLFLPVVWAAARQGLAGATLVAAFTQLGLIAAVQAAAGPELDLTVFELQTLMTAITMTGLMLGVAVDERERAAAELRGSLRLAAAGQMAAALAHELIQPLTALNSYAQASKLLAAAPAASEADRLRRLTEVADRMAADALRASDVVKRLRDFFRSGSTQLQPASIGPLIDAAIVGASARARGLGVRLEVRPTEATLPAVWMDPVQIAVVLRNLIANALEAAAAGNADGMGDAVSQVTVHTRLATSELRIDVLDSGPGLDAARVQTLFESVPSDKPGGMGVGLGICRAIVEAHGGRLWAEPGRSGHVCFTLALEALPGAHDAP